MKLCKTKEFRAAVEIKGKLSKHDGIDDIFNDGSKSSPISLIMEVAEAEVLLNDITLF